MEFASLYLPYLWGAGEQIHLVGLVWVESRRGEIGGFAGEMNFCQWKRISVLVINTKPMLYFSSKKCVDLGQECHFLIQVFAFSGKQ